MKNFLTHLIFICAFLINYHQQKATIKLDGLEIINKSINFHDPNRTWPEVVLNFHIQEPRVYNPKRYSILFLDNSNDGRFQLSRNRDNHLVRYGIDSNKNSYIHLNGKKDIDTSLIAKYKLIPSENIEYKEFYQLMYGLPMSLTNVTENISKTDISFFSEVEYYRIEIELKEEVISKFWYLYISKQNFELLGIEIINQVKPEKNEQLIFDGTIKVNGIKIPRMRDWYEKDNFYLGSDVIIKALRINE